MSPQSQQEVISKYIDVSKMIKKLQETEKELRKHIEQMNIDKVELENGTLTKQVRRSTKLKEGVDEDTLKDIVRLNNPECIVVKESLDMKSLQNNTEYHKYFELAESFALVVK